MPALTLPPSPNGLPIASTQSPTRALSLSPQAVGTSGLSVFTFSTAISVLLSRPRSSALRRGLSCRVTVFSSGPPPPRVFCPDYPAPPHHEARARRGGL